MTLYVAIRFLPADLVPLQTAAENNDSTATRYSLAWIRAQKPQSYVVQFFGSRSRDNATAFLSRVGTLKNVVVAEIEHQESPWFVVLHGHFADLNAAREAISALPAALKAFSPWPRRVSSLDLISN